VSKQLTMVIKRFEDIVITTETDVLSVRYNTQRDLFIISDYKKDLYSFKCPCAKLFSKIKELLPNSLININV
jgi:hypothetical protein